MPAFSTKEQEKEGFSIPAQLKLPKEYADANAIAVVQASASGSAPSSGRSR
jgi:hypothetical protein